jgi:putative SOS response-associated peptidase YedK
MQIFRRLPGLWENWKDPKGEWQRTFAILTVTPNELVAQIHDRMPAILRPKHCDRWLGEEPNPPDVAPAVPG